MRTVICSAFVLCLTLAGCCTNKPAEEPQADATVPAIELVLTGPDGTSMRVHEVKVEHHGSAPGKPGAHDLAFWITEGSDDHVVYPLAEIGSLELTEPSKGLQYPAKVVLRSGEAHSLILCYVEQLTGKTVNEGATFRRRLDTITKLEVVHPGE